MVLGVDTHLDFHVAVAVDRLGRRLGELVADDRRGLRGTHQLGRGLRPRGMCRGGRDRQLRAGLARHLRAAGIAVVEVERPKRRHLLRRRKGKSDSRDAESAARAVLAGEAAGVPKSGDGRVEMTRTLRSARRSAVKARVQAANLLQAMLVTAPTSSGRRLRGLPTKQLVAVAARFRPGGEPEDVEG